MTHSESTGDLSQWWRRLNDPLLSDLIEQALSGSLDLRKAKARLREARARRRVAGAGFYPSVAASGSASHQHSTRNTNAGGSSSSQISASIDASWELDIFGGIRRGIEAANADQESSEATLNAVRVSLIAEVALNYFEVRSLQIRLKIARKNLASQTETLQLTTFRAQAGLINSQDVEQAKSNCEQTLAQIPSLELHLAEGEHRLDVLLGKVPGTLHRRLAPRKDLPAIPYQVAVGIPADMLRQRPDVRAAERNLAAETARIGVAKAALYPSLKISGSMGIEMLIQATVGNSSGAFYSLLGGIIAPIFQGGRLRALVDVQDAVCEQALVTYEHTVLTALQEVENALVTLVRNRQRSEALTRAFEAGRNAAFLARQRYSGGVIDFQSVLDTERTMLSLEDSLTSTRTDGVFALIRLYKALGGGWSSKIKAVQAVRKNP